MFTLVVISLLLAVLYTSIVIWRTDETPDSISAMAYAFEGGWRWSWTIWLWTVAILMTPGLIEVLNGSALQFVAFFCVACLLFCGAMPLFIKEQQKAHDIFGIAGGVLSQVCVVLVSPWWLLVWLPMTVFIADALCAFNNTKERPVILNGRLVFYSEVFCATSTYGMLLSTLC